MNECGWKRVDIEGYGESLQKFYNLLWGIRGTLQTTLWLIVVLLALILWRVW